MSEHRLLAVTLLAIWLLLGPVAMVFDGCMGCELPCAQPACAVMFPVLGMTPDAAISAITRCHDSVIGPVIALRRSGSSNMTVTTPSDVRFTVRSGYSRDSGMASA